MQNKFFILVIVALMFLAFVAGTGVMYFRGPGYTFFDAALGSVEVLGRDPDVYYPNEDELLFGPLRVWPEDWRNPPAPDREPGVIRSRPNRMAPGLTVYTPVYPWMPVKLIDGGGSTWHSWSLSKKLDFGPRLDEVEFESEVQPAITDMHVYPNGDLAAVMGHNLGYQPYGFGVVKLNSRSEVIWSYMKQTHHQLDVADDGRIAVLLNRRVDKPWPRLEKIQVPFLDEAVAVLSPDGEELSVTSVLVAFQRTPWRSVLQFVDPEAWDGDIFHLNAAKFLTAAQAAAVPGASEGDLLISLRNLDVIAVLSVADGEIKWAARGPWHMQHDPDVLANGNILLFDNRGDLGRRGRSRVLEFNPRTLGIEWEWPGAVDFDLWSSVCGSVERLSNGNTLIAETNKGRMIEVAPNGDVVWEYMVPERTVTSGGHIATKVWHPQRLTLEQLPFIAERRGLKEQGAADLSTRAQP